MAEPPGTKKRPRDRWRDQGAKKDKTVALNTHREWANLRFGKHDSARAMWALRELASAYTGPFLGWWRGLRP